MKIAMLTNSFSIGGGTEYIRLIARHMPMHDFTVFALLGGTSPELEGLPNVKTVRSWPGCNAFTSGEFDIIHTHHLRSLLKLCPPCGVPTVNTVHGIHSRQFDFMRGPANATKGFLRKCLEHFLFSRVDANIVLTEDDETYLRDNYRLNNLERIPNGIELPAADAAPADRDALRAELDLPPRRHWLMMTARFATLQKGHDILLEAVLKAKESLLRNQVGIALVGGGDGLPEAKRFVESHDLKDVVFFCGARPGASKYLPLADILLLPSRWEGMPLVALEAGCRGIPVLGSDAPGISSIIRNGETGWLFRSGDSQALADLLADPGCREHAGEFGLRWKKEVEERYTVRQMIEKLDALYRRLEK